jgi:hypothetical protein
LRDRYVCKTPDGKVSLLWLISSGVQPTLPQQQGKKPPGRYLPAGRAVSVNVDEREAQPQQLEVQPITMYNTEASMELRRFVAASASYICYGLKAGQLRVLHRATAARALLRGHTAPVTDLRRVHIDIRHGTITTSLEVLVLCESPTCVLPAASSLGRRQSWPAQRRTGSSLSGASARAPTAC